MVAPMSVFERYLTVWVFLCIVVGIALGQLLPEVFQTIGRMEIAKVNLPVGLLIWVMIIPMLVKVDFAAFPWHFWVGCSFATGLHRFCRLTNSTATSQGLSCWPQRLAPPWCLFGAG